MDNQPPTMPVPTSPPQEPDAAPAPQPVTEAPDPAPVVPPLPPEPTAAAWPPTDDTPAAPTPVVAEPVAPPIEEPVAAPPVAPVEEPVTPAAPVEPPAAPEAPVAPQPAPSEFTPPSHPKRLLLVEDDDSLANVYVTRLETEGFDVRRVANGEEALAAALNYHPDLIILDVMMPKVSGFDVLDILRNTPETANVKIVMLTALSQESDKERAESLGVDDYLVKSQVVIADVIDRIKHHLNLE